MSRAPMPPLIRLASKLISKHNADNFDKLYLVINWVLLYCSGVQFMGCTQVLHITSIVKNTLCFTLATKCGTAFPVGRFSIPNKEIYWNDTT